MHEFEDLVEQSVRCLEASERPGLDHRSLFKQLYAFQEQYDTGYTHGRVLDILEKHRFTYSFPVDAHPDHGHWLQRSGNGMHRQLRRCHGHHGLQPH